jgi:hypothetical protein
LHGARADLAPNFLAINFLRDNPSAHGMKMLQKPLDHADFGTAANTYGDVHEQEVADAVEARGARE